MSQLTIFHTNDLHNRREVFSLLKRVPRGENTIFLDSGDAIGGSNTIFYLNEPVISLMNEVGYTAMAMGNREFNYFRGVLRHRYESAHFPLLSANVKDLTGKSSSFWKEYILVERAGIILGITGLSPVQFPRESIFTKLTGFLFLTPCDVLLSIIGKMREEKADYIIVLSHLGLQEDEQLAKRCDDINLILGGHSHTLLEKPLRINSTYIVQSGCFGRYVGKIEMTAQDHKLNDFTYGLIPVQG